MTAPRNTILKLKGLQEWIAFDGEVYHLTGERGNARPMDELEVKAVQDDFKDKHDMLLEPEPWIIETWIKELKHEHYGTTD